jgi:hypothetical protein
MPVIQFAPFASLVQPGFWHELTRMKIDVLRLSEDAVAVNGSYSVGRSIRDRETGQDIALGCNFTVGEDAYQNAPQYVQCRDWTRVDMLTLSQVATHVRPSHRHLQELQYYRGL